MNEENNIKKPKVQWKKVCAEVRGTLSCSILITGIVDHISSGGSLYLTKIIDYKIWDKLKNKINKIDIPKEYIEAKTITIKRDYINTLIFLEEWSEEEIKAKQEKNDAPK